jgi:hypothetical protein
MTRIVPVDAEHDHRTAGCRVYGCTGGADHTVATTRREQRPMSDPPRPPCQDVPPPLPFGDQADHEHWCKYAREPHEWHACHGCALQWKVADDDRGVRCTCELIDVSVPPGGKPEFRRGRLDGCPVHGAERDASIAAAMDEARRRP